MEALFSRLPARFSSLKWRLIPLYIAAIVLAVPVLQNLYAEHHINQVAAAAELKSKQVDNHQRTIEGTPSRIVIPSLDIDLPVVAGTYSKASNSWTVAPATANYADSTLPLSNHPGQTLIYGHNNDKILGKTRDLAIDAKVYVYTDNGHIFTYRFTGGKDISPTYGNLFEDLKKSTGLKLMTCDGPHFEYRRLMSFTLDKAV